MDQAEEPKFGLWVPEGPPPTLPSITENVLVLWDSRDLPCQGSGGCICRDLGQTVAAFLQEQELKSASTSL